MECLTCQNCFTCQTNVSTCNTCENCFSCQVNNQNEQAEVKQNKPKVKPQKPLTFNLDKLKKKKEPREYFIFLTHGCNLACDYCFAHKDNAKKMSKEIFEATIDFLIREGKERDIKLWFFGGEPTIEWNRMIKMIKKIREVYPHTPAGFTTNGTLLNKERLEYMKKHDIKMLLSIDGDKHHHNLHRKYPDGRGSFDSIPLDLIQEILPQREVRPTITPRNVVGLLDSIKFLYSKGFKSISTEIAYEMDWTDESLAIYKQELEKVSFWWAKNAQDLSLSYIAKVKNVINRGQTKININHRMCGTANNTLGINYKGELFACQRWASYLRSDLAIGTVFEGLWENQKLKNIQSLTRADLKPKDPSKCETCIAKAICLGGCNAVNWELTGKRSIIPDIYCKNNKIIFEEGLKALYLSGYLFGKRQQVRRNNINNDVIDRLKRIEYGISNLTKSIKDMPIVKIKEE